jgi:hypothetical protein
MGRAARPGIGGGVDPLLLKGEAGVVDAAAVCVLDERDGVVGLEEAAVSFLKPLRLSHAAGAVEVSGRLNYFAGGPVDDGVHGHLPFVVVRGAGHPRPW